MARPPKFSPDDLLDGARDAAWEFGAGVTVGQVAQRVGAPIGSIYHRFASKQELLASLWLREIEAFQAPLLDLETADPAVGLERFVVHIPAFCRSRPAAAHALTLYRQEDLVRSGPEALRDRAAHLNDAVTALLRGLAGRQFGRVTERRLGLVDMACRSLPYGLVRPYVGRRDATPPIPSWLDEAVLAASRAVLALA